MMEYPRVGVGVWIFKDGKVLIGKRLGVLGPDTWAPPGGKLEMMETWEECAQREVAEETSLRIRNIRYITTTNDVYPEYDVHYVTMHVVADWESGEPTALEPEKHTDWDWYDWDKLPHPLMKSSGNFVKTGYNPFTI